MFDELKNIMVHNMTEIRNVAEKDAVDMHKQHQQALLVLLREFDRVCKYLDIPYMLFSGTLLGAVRHGGFIPWDDDVDVLMMREDYERFLSQADAVLDREKFFLQKEFSEHWPLCFSKLRLNGTTCLEKYHPRDTKTHQGIYIDLFPCDHACRSLLGRKLQFYASKVVIAKALWKRGYETVSKKKKFIMHACRLLPVAPFLKLARGKAQKSGMVHTFFAAASKYEKNVYSQELFEERVEASFEGERYPIPARYDEILQILYGDYMQLPPPEARAIKQHAILIDPDNSYENYLEYQKGLKFDVLTRSIR